MHYNSEDEFKLKPWYLPFSDHLSAIYGGLALIGTGVYHFLLGNEFLRSTWFIPVPIGIIVLVLGIYQYTNLPKKIKISEQGILIDNTLFEWNTLIRIEFTYISSLHRHVIKIFRKNEAKEFLIYPFLYK